MLMIVLLCILLLITIVFATVIIKENRGGGGGGGGHGGGGGARGGFGGRGYMYPSFGQGFNSSVYDATAWDYPAEYMYDQPPPPLCRTGCKCATPYECDGPCPRASECV